MIDLNDDDDDNDAHVGHFKPRTRLESQPKRAPAGARSTKRSVSPRPLCSSQLPHETYARSSLEGAILLKANHYFESGIWMMRRVPRNSPANCLRDALDSALRMRGVPSVKEGRVHQAGALRALLVKCSNCFYHLSECFGRHSFSVLFAELLTQIMIMNTQVDVDARMRLGNAAR